MGEPSDAALLESLTRLGSIAAAGASSYEVADAVADEVIALVGADASAVFRFDGDDIVMFGGRAAPGHQMFTRGARFPLEDAMVAAAVRESGGPVYAGDYAQREGDAPRRVGELGYQTVVGAPLFVRGRLWGCVYASSAIQGQLEPGSEQALEMFAALCAAVIVNSEHLAQLESQTAEQAALLSVSRTVLERPEAEPVLKSIAREAAALLALDAGAVIRFDSDGAGRLAAEWVAPGAAPLDASANGVAAIVRERGHVVGVGDVDATIGEVEAPVLGRPVGWAAPIEIEQQAWGAVVVAGEHGSPAPPDAADRLGRFTELSSLAIARYESRARLTEQLVETEQFAALVELSDDFIAIASLEGRCLYVNPGGRRMVGLDSLDEARSHDIPDFLTPAGVKASLEVEQPAVRETGSWQGESTLRHFRTGEEIPVSINSFLVTHPLTGAPLVLATVQRDLRERKRTEEELRRQAEELEQLAAARRFLLVEVLEAEERLRRQIGDALHDDALQELYAARQDLEEVGGQDDALERARASVEAAARQLRDVVSDLHPAVSWTRDLEARLRAIVDSGAERGGFRARLDFEADGATGVDDLVLAIVRELVQNVVKHAAASNVTVSVAGRAEGLSVEVADDGRGMLPERPLEALRSGHIGLASARERVEALGGSFDIAGEPGRGTRVAILVPWPATASVPRAELG